VWGLFGGDRLGHVPALLWQQAALPLFTVIRRLGYARAALAANSAGVSPPARGPCAGRRRYLAPWRFPRGSLLYDLVAVLNIAFLAAGPWLYPLFSGSSDPFRRGLERLVAG